MKRAAIIGVAAVLAANAAFAQGVANPGTVQPGSIGGTATGAAPDKTASTTGTGQTKPPGSAVDSRGGTRPDLERESERLDRRINTGICRGC